MNIAQVTKIHSDFYYVKFSDKVYECKIREILKKFGVNTFIIDNVDGSFNASVKVSDSLGFYQWLAAYGKNITVLEPENVRQNYIKYLRDTLDNYL